MVSGNVKKDYRYRKALLARVSMMPNHPIKNGIHMQAHHLISEKSVKESRMGELLEHRGYDINTVKNLVFLPSTLPGACHLGVQVHRGDHKYPNEDENDDDRVHSRSYHREIESKLRRLKGRISDCDSSSKKTVQDILNRVSKKIVNNINSYSLPISRIYSVFNESSEIGCGNSVNIKEHQMTASICKSTRDHIGETHPMYKSGKDRRIITIAKSKYGLRTGK